MKQNTDKLRPPKKSNAVQLHCLRLRLGLLNKSASSEKSYGLFIHVKIPSAKALLEDYVQAKLALNGIGISISTNRGWHS